MSPLGDDAERATSVAAHLKGINATAQKTQCRVAWERRAGVPDRHIVVRKSWRAERIRGCKEPRASRRHGARERRGEKVRGDHDGRYGRGWNLSRRLAFQSELRHTRGVDGAFKRDGAHLHHSPSPSRLREDRHGPVAVLGTQRKVQGLREQVVHPCNAAFNKALLSIRL